MLSIKLAIAVLIFILSMSVIFNEKFRRNKIINTVAGIFTIIVTFITLFDGDDLDIALDFARYIFNEVIFALKEFNYCEYFCAEVNYRGNFIVKIIYSLIVIIFLVILYVFAICVIELLKDIAKGQVFDGVTRKKEQSSGMPVTISDVAGYIVYIIFIIMIFCVNYLIPPVILFCFSLKRQYLLRAAMILAFATSVGINGVYVLGN